MDYAKLQHINGVWIRAADDARLTRLVLERLARRPALALDTDAAHRIAALMPELKQRAKTINELADSAAFLAHPLPLPFEAKAQAALTPEARLMLREAAAALAATDFSREGLDGALRGLAEARGVKLGQIAQPLRAALTGTLVSPAIDVTLAAMGREEALARIAAVAG
jgi:glutamyl-tRNA synthetase